MIKSKNLIIVSIMLITTFSLAACSNKKDTTSSSPSPTVSTIASTTPDVSAAIDFETTLLSNEKVNLSNYKGKVVLLNFWATWCGPCIGELPALQKLSKEYGKDVVILAVNIGEDKETVSQFAKDNGYTFNIGLDEKQEIAMAYQINSIPTTYIIDTEGNIAKTTSGAEDADTMYKKYKSEIDEVLGSK